MYDGGSETSTPPAKKKCGKGEFRFFPTTPVPYNAKTEAQHIRCYMMLMVILHITYGFLGLFWYARPANLVYDLIFGWIACQFC